MLTDLVVLAKRLQSEKRLPPIGYRFMSKQSPIRFVIHLRPDGGAYLEEPKITDKPRPARQRSGKVAQENIKPYLLVDEARYVLGLAEPGKSTEASLLHRGFRSLLERALCDVESEQGTEPGDEAERRTIAAELNAILAFLDDSTAVHNTVGSRVGPKDVITFRGDSGAYLFEREWVRTFWALHIEKEFASDIEGACASCGGYSKLLRMLPTEIVVAGQKCQVVSFNLPAFRSFGREQTTNAPLCFDCGELAAQGLNYLLRDPTRHSALVRDKSKGQSKNPLRMQTAVFWLSRDETIAVQGQTVDVGELVAQPILEAPKEPTRPRLSQLEAFLKAPWTARDSALQAPNAFFLAVLSANKGRLTVRDWLVGNLESLRSSLAAFISAVRVIDPMGTRVQAFGIPELVESFRAREGNDANLIRGLLRTAYTGAQPPNGLFLPALHQLRIPKDVNESWSTYHNRLARLMSVVKLALTYGKEDAQRMEHLDRERNVAAYLCGRVLASLEEAQMRHALPGRLNSTLVDRFYGSASTAPCAYLPGLIRLAESAHLPKIRREQRGFAKLDGLFQDLLSRLDEAGGFPRRLTVEGQAEFALGYYHQRAEFAADRPTARETSQTNPRGEAQ